MIDSITITVPIPDKCLRPNGNKSHWSKVSKARHAQRLGTFMECKKALAGRKSPMWEKCIVAPEVRFSTHHRMDNDNIIASLKGVFDGIQDAGIVANDQGLWASRPTIITRSKEPGITLTISPE